MRCVYPFNNGEPAWGLGSIDYFCTTSFPFPGFGGRAEKTCLFPRQFSALVFPDNYSSTIPMIFSEVLPAAVLQKTRNVLSKAPALSGIISTLISDFSPGMTGLRFHDGFVHPQEASMWVITSGLSPMFPGRRPPVPCCRSSNPEPRFPVGRYGCRSWEPCPPSSRILSPYTAPKAAAYASGCRPIEPCWCCRGENIGRPGSSESHSACRFHFTVDIKRQFEPVGS